MKLKLMACILAIGFVNSMAAQFDSLDLSKYKIIDFEYNALISSVSVDHRNSKTSTQYLNNNQESQGSSINSNNFIEYEHRSNSLQFQKAQISFLSFGFNISTSGTSSSVNESIRLTTRLQHEQSIRNYYSDNEYFEIDLDLDVNLRKLNQSADFGSGVQETKNYTINTSNYLKLSTGVGRIDPVSDARHAAFILKYLNKEDRLKRIPDSTEILAFAQIINQVKNKRLFDFRIQRIYELERIDSFLQKSNLISTADMRYFATLNDMWAYGAGPLRSSGSRFSLALVGGFDYLKQKEEITFIPTPETNLKTGDLLIGLNYIKEKPINLFVQNSLTTYGYLGYSFGKMSSLTILLEEPYDIQLPKLNFGIENKIGYFPNTRTNIEYSIFGHFTQVFDFLNASVNNNGENTIKFSSSSIFIGSSLLFNYFISPQLRVRVRPDFTYSYNRTKLSENDIIIEDGSIQNHIEFLIRPRECDAQTCRFDLNPSKRYLFGLSIDLNYNFF